MGLNLTILFEVFLFSGIVGIQILILFCLVTMAYSNMAPRPVFLKPDKFRDYDNNNNWNWDFVLAFAVRSPTWVGSEYARHHSLRKIIERLDEGGLQTICFKSQRYDKIFVKIRADRLRLKKQADFADYLLKVRKVPCLM